VLPIFGSSGVGTVLCAGGVPGSGSIDPHDNRTGPRQRWLVGVA
jgi:hypothetical protein